MEAYSESYYLVRLLFQRGLAVIYFVAFLSALNQFKVLLGERGLLPVPQFLKVANFQESPSIFHLFYSDSFFTVVAGLGVLLSLIVVSGISEKGPIWVSMLTWFILYILYLSIVNVGQTFYSFGWESMLLEAGFFAMFLGPSGMAPSVIPILILRWMLFRTELGSGLIKLRHDPCWKDLTCLFYHYETQPLPNPLSWYFHYLPSWVHRFGVLFSNAVQTVVPFGLFFPQPFASIAGALIIFHMLWLGVSGNYSWLNWLTIVLGFTAFSDSMLRRFLPISIPELSAAPGWYSTMLLVLLGITILLSIKPTLNLFSRNQLMNYNYNPFHIVGTYGAFGSMTKERYEIIVEGTDETVLRDNTVWKAYEFRGKPGNIMRRPRQVGPYHLRLDWLMWFLPFSVRVDDHGLEVPGHELWFLRFAKKLLENDQQTLALLEKNPFPDHAPRFLRAQFYRYQYTDPEERRVTGAWWKRTFIGDYLSPVALSHLQIVSP